MVNLKNKPLYIQIWIILGGVLVISFILLFLLSSIFLKISFTKENFARLEDSQQYILHYDSLEMLKEKLKSKKDKDIPPPPDSIRIVDHIFITNSGDVLGRELSSDIMEEIQRDIKLQQQDKKNYFKEIDNVLVMYIIRIAEIEGQQGYMVSYLWGRYRDDLVKLILWNLLKILFFVLLVSWFASIYIARYLSRPLIMLQNRVKEIANRRWTTPVKIDRGDEIGQLANAVEWMRCQLLEYHQKQQSFLQQISHELKTPIMVIRSYAHSISDGIFPGGSLEDSVKVIENETERLEKRVHTLLHITKLDYISIQELKIKEFNLAELVEKIADTFSWRNTELDWVTELESVIIKADKDKLTIALENLFDNQIRYANSTIKIKLSRDIERDDKYIILQIWNDGPEIESEIIENIFKQFKKGSSGEYGLGLSIVKTIIDMHQGQIWVKNEDGGVSFYIRLKDRRYYE